MFRPKHKRNPKHYLPAHRDSTPGHAAPPIVGAIESIIDLIGRMISIVFTLIVAPRRIDEKILGLPGRAFRLPKYAFLTLCVFWATKTLRFIVATILFGSVLFIRGCEPVTQISMRTSNLDKELSSISFNQILGLGLPIVIAVILLFMATLGLLRSHMSEERRRRLYEVSIYIAGFQYLILDIGITISFILNLNQLRAEDLTENPGFDETDLYVLFASMTISIIWGSALYTVSYMRLCSDRTNSNRRITSVLGCLFATTIISTTVVSAGIVAAVPLAISEVQKQLIRPVLKIWRGPMREAPDGGKDTILVVENKGERPIFLLNEDVIVLIDDLRKVSMAETARTNASAEGERYLGVVKEWDGRHGATILEPRRPIVIGVVLYPLPTEAMSDCRFEPWGTVPQKSEGITKLILDLLPPDFRVYPIPDFYWARVCFLTIDQNDLGYRSEVVGFIQL